MPTSSNLNDLIQNVRVSYERVFPEGAIEVTFKVDGVAVRFWPESGAECIVLRDLPLKKGKGAPDYERCLQDLLAAFK